MNAAKQRTVCLLALLQVPLLLTAGEPQVTGDKQVVDTLVQADTSLCDVFKHATLYENKENPFIQKFALSGRLQADAVFFREGGEDYDSLHWRRLRSGFKANVFQDFIVHAEAEFDLNERSPWYERLTDTYLGWAPSEAFELKIGKHAAQFTMDGATSSKELIRMERSLLSTNLWFPEEYHSGVAANGEIGNWSYNAGVFSSSGGEEFGDFDGGMFGLVSIGYDFASVLGMDKALIRADYVNNNPNENNEGTRSFAQVGSLNGTFEKGKIGLRTDVAAGDGYGHQSDVFAIALMPYYNVTKKIQLVTSYNYVTSSGENGVRLDRYETSLVSGRVDKAHEFYAGVNYYLCGHKLKWQTGVEYTTAEDAAEDGGAYDGWGVSSGLRVSW